MWWGSLLQNPESRIIEPFGSPEPSRGSGVRQTFLSVTSYGHPGYAPHPHFFPIDLRQPWINAHSCNAKPAAFAAKCATWMNSGPTYSFLTQLQRLYRNNYSLLQEARWLPSHNVPSPFRRSRKALMSGRLKSRHMQQKFSLIRIWTAQRNQVIRPMNYEPSTDEKGNPLAS